MKTRLDIRLEVLAKEIAAGPKLKPGFVMKDGKLGYVPMLTASVDPATGEKVTTVAEMVQKQASRFKAGDKVLIKQNTHPTRTDPEIDAMVGYYEVVKRFGTHRGRVVLHLSNGTWWWPEDLELAPPPKCKPVGFYGRYEIGDLLRVVVAPYNDGREGVVKSIDRDKDIDKVFYVIRYTNVSGLMDGIWGHGDVDRIKTAAEMASYVP